MSIVDDFVKRVQATYNTHHATEHSYRPDLQFLLNGLSEKITAINEPKRIACGAPDFLVQRGEIAIGHVEAKDVNIALRNMKDANKAQQERYRAGLPNLVYTNCLDWDFYRDGQLVASVTIGGLGKAISPHPGEYASLEAHLRDFIDQKPQTITSPKRLAEIMAGKAVLIKDILQKTLQADKNLKSEIYEQYKAFKDHLIHDITPNEFSDIYAETIAYGMFAARLHDTSLETFSRQKALELLPKSNPFLRSLFGYIAGPDLDDRLRWIINYLAEVFQAVDVKRIMTGFGNLSGQSDPFLHFYETFLAAYNPAKRRARGVWYTPEAVVSFIITAVDHTLQTSFGLMDGLTDTSKVVLNWDTGQNDKKGKPIRIKRTVHRVQLLDPATGTGTFLAGIIKHIAPKVKEVAAGMWSQYVEQDLIPRLHGFELLMASYAMCHMKLDMILTELGYTPTALPPRLSVYLTNSLEEGEAANQTLPFAQWLSNEVKQANTIKRDMPIMCVIGNPPYNASSKNNNPWIARKMDDYKRGLGDRKVNVNDDYMKFIRLAEDLIERNGSGVVAMITNNSFLDGTTQRQMRAHLLSTFDEIDVFNLHGDIRAQQAHPHDENMFDITQGVAITIMKRTRTEKVPVVRYTDLIGRRAEKTAWLENFPETHERLQAITPDAPYFFFVPKNFGATGETFALDAFFEVKSSGIQTKNDMVAVSWTAAERDSVIDDFQNKSLEQLEQKYPSMEVWTTEAAQKDILSGEFEKRTIFYRPFDVRHTVLTRRSGGFLGRPRYNVMQHIQEGDLCLIVNKKHVGNSFSHVSVASSIVAHGLHYLGNRAQDYVLPLYLASDGLDADRRVNYDPQLFARVLELATDEPHGAPDELQVFDYIYGVLHSPTYRAQHAEHLKIGFPQIPWPATPAEFWMHANFGLTLRELHLLVPHAVGKTSFPFRGQGDGFVLKEHFTAGKIWINDAQGFEDVPQTAWDAFFGGYQPARKWLKDRRGRTLSYEDIRHYQRILKVLVETDRIVQELPAAHA